MNTLDKAELTTSIHHNERFLKSDISIYNYQVLGMVCKKNDRKKEKKKNISNCKALCVLRKRKKMSKTFFRKLFLLKH